MIHNCNCLIKTFQIIYIIYVFSFKFEKKNSVKQLSKNACKYLFHFKFQRAITIYPIVGF